MKDLAPKNTIRQRIPPIRVLVEKVRALFPERILSHEFAVRLARISAQALRDHPQAELSGTWLSTRLRSVLRPGPRRVINATGILLHTNLGRTPLSRDSVLQALDQVEFYTDLELDPASGKRGHRDRHFRDLAQIVWDVEDATLVNNAASAIYLALAGLAGQRRVLVSRGELIEIGGGFRLTDIMNLTGAQLVEVGSTNKTNLADYRCALDEFTGCLLKTHPSNYRVEGFAADVPLLDLVGLGREFEVPVVMDLGSGLSKSSRFPVLPEPFIEDYLAADPDLLIFSGDKLLGSVQAGLVLGKRHTVEKLRNHPAMRMFRVDKLTISILCHHLAKIARSEETALSRLALVEVSTLQARAKAIAQQFPNLEIEVCEDVSFLGGGSLPQESRPSVSLRVRGNRIEQLAKNLRFASPPLIGYIRHNSFVINLASVLPEQDLEISALLHGLD